MHRYIFCGDAKPSVYDVGARSRWFVMGTASRLWWSRLLAKSCIRWWFILHIRWFLERKAADTHGLSSYDSARKRRAWDHGWKRACVLFIHPHVPCYNPTSIRSVVYIFSANLKECHLVYLLKQRSFSTFGIVVLSHFETSGLLLRPLNMPKIWKQSCKTLWYTSNGANQCFKKYEKWNASYCNTLKNVSMTTEPRISDITVTAFNM